METEAIFGGIATGLGIICCSLYLWQVLQGRVKPHIFSWFIWGVVGIIGFAAQYAANAGPESWAIGTSALLCFVITTVSFFKGERSITRSDWLCLVFASLAIPAWVATKNPLWATIIVSAVDAAGFYPTFRKSWMTPHEEGMLAFFLYGLQMFFSLLALQSVSVTTALYPATILVLNAALTATLFCRRRMLA